MALKIAQNYKYVEDDYWNWSAWIEGSDSELDQIESVTYNLHPTFPNPIRTIKSRKNKFLMETAGWGTFTLYAKVKRKNGSTQRLKHELELRYPDGKLTTA
jgi:transcription initiation factor IIF auxiliary subunit